jgi:hypothetical protein
MEVKVMILLKEELEMIKSMGILEMIHSLVVMGMILYMVF